jgi:uncharacterized membrane protein
MKLSTQIAIAIFLALFILILAPAGRVQAQTTYTQYNIQLNADGSTVWTITQVAGVNDAVDTFAGFQQNVSVLTSLAEVATNRSMSPDNNSFEINTQLASDNSKTVQYIFTWYNFSETDRTQLTVGDVFAVPNFFSYLFGDGALQIQYPLNYEFESQSSSTPYENYASSHTLIWLGTQFFVGESPRIFFVMQSSAGNTGEQPSVKQPPYLLIGSLVGVAIAAGAVGWVLLTNNRKKQVAKPQPQVQSIPLLETEEEKIIRALRASGGSAYQSSIKDQCNFSKAKTSQLLSALEQKGVVTRVKKGRDKIVNLNQTG